MICSAANFSCYAESVMLLSCSLSPAQQAGKETTASPDAPQLNAETLNPKQRGSSRAGRTSTAGLVAAAGFVVRFRACSGPPRPSVAARFASLSQFRLVLRRFARNRRARHEQLSADDRHQPGRGRTKIYGWVDPTLNFSTSTQQQCARSQQRLLKSFRDESIRPLCRALARFRAAGSRRLGLST